MNVIIVDYNSGNISSVINSFREVAKDKVNITVTADLNKIKSTDKVVLPGQGSFKSCIDALNKINGLSDTLNQFVITNKKSFGYGQTDREDEQILTPEPYQNAFEKIENAVFIRSSS